MKFLYSYGAVVMFIFLFSCKKIDVPKDTPRSIKKEIREKSEDGCLEKVVEYEYNGNTVYYFLTCSTNNDWSGYFLNEDGDSICLESVPYGPTGGTYCLTIYYDGTEKEVVWEKQ